MSGRTDDVPKLVTVAQFFDVWYAAEHIYGKPDIGIKVGAATSNAPPSTAFYSLVSSPNYLVGMDRLSKYKKLYEPIRTRVIESNEHCSVSFLSQDPASPIPLQLVIAHIVFSINTINKLTNKKIVPTLVELNTKTRLSASLRESFGAEVTYTNESESSLHFKLEDAKQPFLTENAALWAKVEAQLIEDIEALEISQSITARVRKKILSNITTKSFSLKHLHHELGMSQSTLQRRLGEEGTSFRKLLDETRIALATEYLKQNKVCIKEIAYMLGYSDPNSFYRYFKRSTGQSPDAYRKDSM